MAAWDLGSVSLANTQYNNAVVLFGLLCNHLKSLTRKDPGESYKWTDKAPPPPQPRDDFVVIFVA